MQDCDGNGNWGMLTAWIPFYAENGNNLAISAKKKKKEKTKCTKMKIKILTAKKVIKKKCTCRLYQLLESPIHLCRNYTAIVKDESVMLLEQWMFLSTHSNIFFIQTHLFLII